MRWGSCARVWLAGLALAVAAAAVQPVYRVDANTIFLPLDGLALNARNGHVAWRFPRYHGQTYSNGNGLLVLSWVAALVPRLHHRTTRICRLRTRDGKVLWCTDRATVEQWVVGNAGRHIYVHSPGRLEVLNISNGDADRGFDLSNDGDLTLLPLPDSGLVMLLRQQGQVQEVLSLKQGAAVLRAESVPAGVYAFRGNGQGLLLYAKPKHEFFLAAPFKQLFGGLAAGGAPAGFFPRASLNSQGFLVSDWQGDAPVVRGGNYQGSHWQAPRTPQDNQLALSSQTGLLLAPLSSHASRLEGWDLNGGRQRYGETIEGQGELLHAGDGVVVLQSDNDTRLLDAKTGKQRWRLAQHTGTLAAITESAVVFWDGSGFLRALSRAHGRPLWRVHFKRIGAPLP